jgi:hypothetical protein
MTDSVIGPPVCRSHTTELRMTHNLLEVDVTSVTEVFTLCFFFDL